jgi:hypothetical protein
MLSRNTEGSKAWEHFKGYKKKRRRFERLHGTDFHVPKEVWQECDGRHNDHKDK